MGDETDGGALELRLDAVLELGIKRDDEGLGRLGERDVALGDGSDGAADNLEAYLARFDFDETAFEGFEGAFDVGLE